jgi:hypothetical protein
MTPVARLFGLVMPACAAHGAEGVPLPPADLATLRRASSPNSALAAPPGFMPASGRAPDLATDTYPIPAAALLGALRVVARRQPRTYELDNRAAGISRADWVARSALCNYPDVISAQVADTASGGSTLILFSRSIYGYSDLGVNAKRIAAWLDALQTAGA